MSWDRHYWSAASGDVNTATIRQTGGVTPAVCVIVRGQGASLLTVRSARVTDIL